MPTTDDRLRKAGAAWRDHVDGTAPPAKEPSPRAAAAGPLELRRRRAVRRHRLVALAMVGAAAVTLVAFAVLAAPSFRGLGGGGGSASCAAPTLTAQGTTGHGDVRSGQTLTVTGLYYVTDCYDSGQRGDPPPYGTVRLSLARGTHVVGLSTVHPDHDGAFTTTVRIPEDFPTGPATLRTDTPAARELELVVTRATPSPRPQSSSSTNR